MAMSVKPEPSSRALRDLKDGKEKVSSLVNIQKTIEHDPFIVDLPIQRLRDLQYVKLPEGKFSDDESRFGGISGILIQSGSY